jgi:hypothetical protein
LRRALHRDSHSKHRLMETDAELIDRLSRHMTFLVTATSLEKLRPRFPRWVKELRNLGHISIPVGPLPLTLEEVWASNDINRLLNEAAAKNFDAPRWFRRQKAWVAHDLRDLSKSRR